LNTKNKNFKASFKNTIEAAAARAVGEKREKKGELEEIKLT
jgi:hypothetical protein